MSLPEAIRGLVHTLEKQRLALLLMAVPCRVNPRISPFRGDYETPSKEKLMPSGEPPHPWDREGTFLFRHKSQFDIYADRLVSMFGAGDGKKPRTLDASGVSVEVEGGSVPFWMIDDATAATLEGLSDDLVSACQNVVAADGAGACTDAIGKAMLVVHDGDHSDWQSSRYIRWKYYFEMVDAISAAKKALIEVLRHQPTSEGYASGDCDPAASPVVNAPTCKQGQGANDIPKKRSWKQADLDEGIRKYWAKRGPAYRNLVKAVKAGRPGAIRDARRLFGRNVIAEALGVKSPKMVSNSPVWMAIAEDLQIPLARERIKGTRRTGKRGRVGFDMAIEEASVEGVQRHDGMSVPTDGEPAAAIENLEKEETLVAIRKLERSRVSGAKTYASALLDSYQKGDMDDDQVRETVNMMLDPTA